MATRGGRLDLSDSWDDAEDSQDSKIFSRDDEKQEMGSYYQSTQSTDKLSRESSSLADESDEEKIITLRAPKYNLRLSPEAEPRLIMPGSPNGLLGSGTPTKLRARTPHMRGNERSMTSDAGALQRRAGQQKSKKTSSVQDSSKPHHKQHLSQSDVVSIVLGWLQQLLVVILDSIRSVLRWVRKVVHSTFYHPIVIYGVGTWFAIGLFFLARNFMLHSVQHALSPVCRLPLVSWLDLPFCPHIPSGELSSNAEFDKLMQAQEQFNDILTSTANGAALPLEMKRSEAGIRDLRQVVKYSALPSKNELLLEFGGFIETAQQASRDLGRFNTHIGGAVDQILTTNRYTLKVLEGLALAKAEQQGVASWVGDHLNIFAIFQPVPLNRDILTNQYLLHATAVEERILALVAEAQILLGVLDNLDGRLDVISDIATRDGITVGEGKDALFALLWTKLGGNRSSVQRLNSQLQLLNEVGTYRRMARAHVAGTIVKLQAIQSQLEDLRDRVAMPEVLGAKMPLEQQIENVLLGVERLEEERQANRKSIEEHNAKVYSRSSWLDSKGQIDS